MLTPDTIVPYPANPQSFNRFSYAYNNPINYSDPSGHNPVCNQDGSICSVDPYDDGNPTLPSSPPDGLTDRPFPYGGAGPGGLQAYNGLQTLQETSNERKKYSGW